MRHLATGAVNGAKIRNRSVRLADLHPEIASAKGVLGPRGPQGPTGARGPAGANGAALALHVKRASVIPTQRTTLNQVKTEFTIDWTQPAGTLDELSGDLQLVWTDKCMENASSKLRMRLLDGTRVISSAVADANFHGNELNQQGTNANSILTFTPPVQSASVDARRDLLTLPIELPWFHATQSTQRSVQLQLSYDGCINGTLTPPELRNVNAYVKRYVA